MASRNGKKNMIIVIIAIIGILLAGVGFYKSTKDKAKRAQFAGVRNIAAPSTRFLPFLDLGNIGDDIRYTVGRASTVGGPDPDWRKNRNHKAGMHGIDGASGLDHSLNAAVNIVPPLPVDDYPLLTIASGPNDNQNHETVAGTFLPAPKNGRKLTGTSVRYNYLGTPPRWGSLVGTAMTPYETGGFELPTDTEVLDQMMLGQAYPGIEQMTGQTPLEVYGGLADMPQTELEYSDIAEGLIPTQAYLTASRARRFR